MSIAVGCRRGTRMHLAHGAMPSRRHRNGPIVVHSITLIDTTLSITLIDTTLSTYARILHFSYTTVTSVGSAYGWADGSHAHSIRYDSVRKAPI